MKEHQVHGAGSGDAELDERLAVLAPPDLLPAARPVDVGRVPEPVERPADRGESCPPRIPGDVRDRVAQVEPDLRDAGDRGGELLHQPDARRAVDSFEVEAGPVPSAREPFGRLGLLAGVVEVGEGPAGDLRRLEGPPLLLHETVVLVAPPLRDQGVDLPAPFAAELSLLPLADEVLRHRETAVRAPRGSGTQHAVVSRSDHLAGPPSGASGSTVTRAAWTNRSDSRVASSRNSHSPARSSFTRVR